MSQQKRNMGMKTKRSPVGVLVMVSLVGVALLSGCSHRLEVKNLDDYTSLSIPPLDRPLTIGMISETGDIHCAKIVKKLGESLTRRSANVMLPYNTSSSRKVDVVASISIQPDYKGSGWNFLINWPGFLIFTPAWHGYVYKVNYDVGVVLTKGADQTEIDSFELPINLNVRHAAMNRTWTEISWFEVSAIAFVGGIFFTQYDDTVSPLVLDTVGVPLGDYLADEIVRRINNSGKLTHMTGENTEQRQRMLVRLE